MILVQVSVTGQKPLGSLHIVNISGTGDQATYRCTFYEGDGREGLKFFVNHERGAGWSPLVMACLERLDTRVKG